MLIRRKTNQPTNQPTDIYYIKFFRVYLESFETDAVFIKTKMSNQQNITFIEI